MAKAMCRSIGSKQAGGTGVNLHSKTSGGRQLCLCLPALGVQCNSKAKVAHVRVADSLPYTKS